MTSAPEKTAAEKEELVTVTIDGLQISVPKGTLLIRAAEQLGISIPRFCDHPLLDPAGACRQCLVEVPDMGNGRGMPKPAASCTTTVMPGMVIKTQLTSHVADKAQQGVMELLLINHPLDCPICDKGGECPLQNQAMSNGRADSRFHEKKRTFPKPLAISSNVLLDRERCVLCQRCTRFSLQIAGDPFIELLERGADQQIGTSEEVPFQSYFSGNTVQICPVGALTGASYRFRARPFDLQSTDSICEHCSSGCAQRTDWRRSKVTRRLAGSDPEVNEEWNCDKGRWAFHNAEQADRILTPLVRNDAGELVEASWPEALERAATGLAEAADRGGVGVLPGGRLTEEDAYTYAKFARVALDTNDVDARSRPGSAEELDFLAAHVAGVTPEHVSYRSLEKARAVLLVGFEPEEESPIVFLRLRKATRHARTKVWSVAALESSGLAKLNGTLLATVPGDEAATIRALSDDVVDALRADGAVIVVGERLATAGGALSAAAELAASTGARLAWVPRRAGERGAVDAGALPTLLPGGRSVADAAHRAEVEQI
jgi:NADH-quinone oxidoreductase subunit G